MFKISFHLPSQLCGVQEPYCCINPEGHAPIEICSNLEVEWRHFWFKAAVPFEYFVFLPITVLNEQ